MFLALAPPYAASAARASAFPDGRRRSGDTSIALGHASVQLSEEPSSMAWADARACSRVAAARTLFRMQLLLLQHRPTKQLCFGSAARRARILPGHRRCHHLHPARDTQRSMQFMLSRLPAYQWAGPTQQDQPLCSRPAKSGSPTTEASRKPSPCCPLSCFAASSTIISSTPWYCAGEQAHRRGRSPR